MGNKGIIKLIVFTLLISAASTAQGRRKAAALTSGNDSFGLHSQCKTAPTSPHEDYGEGDARGDEQQG